MQKRWGLVLCVCFVCGCARPSAPAAGWCYIRLTDAEQAAYTAVYTAAQSTRDEPAVVGGQTVTGAVARWDSPLSEESTARVYEAVLADHPELICLRRTCAYDWQDGGCTALTVAFSAPAAERQRMATALSEAVHTVLRDMPPDADAFERMLYCHDTLARRCRYKEEAVNAPDLYPSAFTAYGALVEGEAVCEGYARALALLLARVDIDGTTVTGTANGTPHMWNVAKIDGALTEVDVTWDDSPEGLRHTYCGLTSAEMAKSRTAAMSAVGTVTATATDNYHRRTGRYIENTSREALEAALAQFDGQPLSLRFSEQGYPLHKGRLLFGAGGDAYTCVFDDELCTVTLFPAAQSGGNSP